MRNNDYRARLLEQGLEEQALQFSVAQVTNLDGSKSWVSSLGLKNKPNNW